MKTYFLATLNLGIGIAALLAASGAHAQLAAFDWAELLTSIDEENDMIDFVADSEGNSALAYSFNDPASTFSSYTNNHVAKVDARGTVLWTQDALPSIYSLARGPNGCLFVAGSLLRSSPSSGLGLAVPLNYFSRIGVTNQGNSSAYVAKLSPDGGITWARLVGSTQKIVATDVGVGDDNSYYVTGYYNQGSVQFGNTVLPAPTSTTARNLFVAKYAADGELQWAQAGVGTSYVEPQIAIDPSGNIVVGSASYAPYTFTGGIVTGGGGFLVKFDSDGKPLWKLDQAGPFALDRDGNLFVGTLDYANQRLLLNKYGPSGDLLWNRQAQANSSANWQRIALDAEGNCVAVGQFSHGPVQSGTYLAGEISVGDTTISTVARNDIFVVKYTPTGDVRWLLRSEGQDADYYNSSPPYRISQTSGFVSVDPGGGIVVGGALQASVKFGASMLDGPSISFRALSTIFEARIVESYTSIPVLGIQRGPTGLRLSWLASFSGFALETSNALTPSDWNPVPILPILDGDQNVVTVQAVDGLSFFRLRKL